MRISISSFEKSQVHQRAENPKSEIGIPKSFYLISSQINVCFVSLNSNEPTIKVIPATTIG